MTSSGTIGTITVFPAGTASGEAIEQWHSPLADSSNSALLSEVSLQQDLGSFFGGGLLSCIAHLLPQRPVAQGKEPNELPSEPISTARAMTIRNGTHRKELVCTTYLC